MNFTRPRPGVLLAAALLVFSGCGETDQPAAQERARPVEISAVRTMRLEQTVTGIGSLKALETVQLAAEIAGRVSGIHFTEGDQVAAGDLLFSLDDAELQLELEARQAALAEARTDLAQARREHARRRQLLPQDLVSQESADRAETAVNAAAARLERLQAEIGRARELLADTSITAPAAGRIGARQVDVGDFVSAGQALATLVNTERLKLAFTIPERMAGQAAVGQQVHLYVDAWPDETFAAEVYFVSPSISVATRSLLLQAYVDNGRRRLRPGNFAAAELVTGVREAALVIPEEALVPTRQGYQVFVVEDATARLREVDIGLRQPGLVEITAGLAAGDRVVRRGHIELSDGDPVRALEATSEPENGS